MASFSFMRSAPIAVAGATVKPARDLRLDFFRGLALFFIFVDHIPNNVASWVTVRNFGLSDATEIFIFISGYSAMLAYGTAFDRRGFLFASAQALKRCWQIYVAHIFLMVIFIGHITYVSHRYNNPMFVEEMGLAAFVEEPHLTLIQALLLKFKPVNLDILPLYIMLLLVFPAVLWGMKRNANAVVAASVVVYVVANAFNLTLPSYPKGVWFFNPFAWQLLFVLGAYFGLMRGTGLVERLSPVVFVPLSIAYLAFALFLVATWSNPSLAAYVPKWFAKLIYPIDKTNLDILRLVHFFALAYLTVYFVKADAAFLRWRVFRPVIVCGQQSLHVFCLGTFLSFAGHFVLTEINASIAAQILVSVTGIVLMVALASLITWYRDQETAVRASKGVAASILEPSSKVQS